MKNKIATKMTQEERQMWIDIYNFRAQYYKVSKCDSYWKSVIYGADKLSKKYNTRLCKEILLGVMAEFERGLKNLD